MKNLNYKKCLGMLVFLLFISGSSLQAQPPGFEGGVDDEPQAPIDGFVGAALAVGAYFGAKKLRRKEE